MNSCRKWRDHLIEAVYGELEGERRALFESHLDSCSRCTAEFEGFSATAEHIAEALPPRPQLGELDVWKNIAPRLEDIDRRKRSFDPRPGPRLSLGYPSAAALATALLAIGLGLGLFLRSPTPTLVPTPTLTAEVDRENVAFARYLERSTPLLLAVANRRTGGDHLARDNRSANRFNSDGFDSKTERQLAERLAAEATQLSDKLRQQGQRRQADLLGDLAVVFLQIANLPEREYRNGIQMVQATIESRALLFQLSVEEMRRL